MRIIKLAFCSIASLFFYGCNDYSFTYEIDPITHDTINRTVENMRQGPWFIHTDCAKDFRLPVDTTQIIGDTIIGETIKTQTRTIVNTSLPGILLKGSYIDNKKQGIWTSYAEDGSVVRTEEFKDDLPVHN